MDFRHLDQARAAIKLPGQRKRAVVELSVYFYKWTKSLERIWDCIFFIKYQVSDGCIDLLEAQTFSFAKRFQFLRFFGQIIFPFSNLYSIGKWIYVQAFRSGVVYTLTYSCKFLSKNLSDRLA